MIGLSEQWRIAGRSYARKRNRVRAYAKSLFEFYGVIKQTHQVEAPVIKTEQAADRDIVDSGLVSAMMYIETPLIIALDGVGRMQLTVCFVVICFLKNLVSADADFVQFTQVVYA